jgi:hypothetical protein
MANLDESFCLEVESILRPINCGMPTQQHQRIEVVFREAVVRVNIVDLAET